MFTPLYIIAFRFQLITTYYDFYGNQFILCQFVFIISCNCSFRSISVEVNFFLESISLKFCPRYNPPIRDHILAFEVVIIAFSPLYVCLFENTGCAKHNVL